MPRETSRASGTGKTMMSFLKDFFVCRPGWGYMMNTEELDKVKLGFNDENYTIPSNFFECEM